MAIGITNTSTNTFLYGEGYQCTQRKRKGQVEKSEWKSQISHVLIDDYYPE